MRISNFSLFPKKFVLNYFVSIKLKSICVEAIRYISYKNN